MMETRKSKRLLFTTFWVLGIAITGVVLFELVYGLLWTDAFQNLPVEDMLVMDVAENQPYFSIDIPAGRVPFNKMRVRMSEIKLKVDPSITSDIVISSNDGYIWGHRWPWVEKVTLTLKTEEQKEGFDALLEGERLSRLGGYNEDGMCFGVTLYGQLTKEGRVLSY